LHMYVIENYMQKEKSYDMINKCNVLKIDLKSILEFIIVSGVFFIIYMANMYYVSYD